MALELFRWNAALTRSEVGIDDRIQSQTDSAANCCHFFVLQAANFFRKSGTKGLKNNCLPFSSCRGSRERKFFRLR